MNTKTQCFLLFVFAVLSMLTVALTGCQGTRVRSAVLDVDASTVHSQLDQHVMQIRTKLEQNATDQSTQIATRDLETFLKLRSLPDNTLYYSEAPGAMGEIGSVMDINFSALKSAGSDFGLVKKIYAYFVVAPVSDGWRGGLLITGDDELYGDLGPLPTTSETPAVQNTLTFSFVAVNDYEVHPQIGGLASMIFPAGELLDDEFVLDLGFKGDRHLVVRTDDVHEGDLTQVIQIRVYEVDRATGDESSVAVLNMAQP